MTDPAERWSAPKTPDYIQDICNKIRLQVEIKTNKVYELFRAYEYKTHADKSDGDMYLIKVHVGGERYIVVDVFQHLPDNGGMLDVNGIQEYKVKDDPIEPF